MENSRIFKILTICLVFFAGITIANAQSVPAGTITQEMIDGHQQHANDMNPVPAGKEVQPTGDAAKIIAMDKAANDKANGIDNEKARKLWRAQQYKAGNMTAAEAAEFENERAIFQAEQRIELSQELKQRAINLGNDYSRYDTEIAAQQAIIDNLSNN